MPDKKGNNSRNDGRSLTSLADLGNVVLVPLPELPQIDLLPTEDLEATAETIRQGAGGIGKWVSAALSELDRVAGISREARELVADKVAATKETLAGYLRDGTPAYRRAAWLAILAYEFSRPLQTGQDVQTLLAKLAKDGYLHKDPDGPISYGEKYAISEDSFFGDEEVAIAKRLFTGLLRRVRDAETRHDITAEELLAGIPGTLTLGVPPEEVKNPDGTTKFWRGGGEVRFQSDGGHIFPLSTMGSISAAVREAMTLKVRLLVQSLQWDTPPFIRGITKEQGIKVQLLWHLTKRALRAQEEAKKIQAQKEVFAEKADTSPADWFLCRRPGTCLADYEDVWETKNPDGKVVSRIQSMFCLVSREVAERTEGTGTISIAEVPDHLTDFFAQCMDEYEERDKFEGVPWPLIGVLRAVYGQVLQASRDTEKAVQVAVVHI